MNFFDSISYPYRFWEIFCLTPFFVDQIPGVIPKRIRTFYVTIVFVLIYPIIIIFYVVVGIYKKLYITSDLWILITSTIISATGSLTFVTILIESFFRRNVHKQLLLQFEQIDLILMQNIGITIDYMAERCQYKRRVKTRCVIYCSLITVLGFGEMFFRKYYIFGLHNIVGGYIHVLIIMWFHQYTIFVDVIYKRFYWINDRIRKICSTDLNRIIIEENSSRGENGLDKIQFLRDLRKVSQSLLEASEKINKMFAVSSALYIFYEFISIFLSNYFYFEWAIKYENMLILLYAVILLIPRCDNLFSLAAACESATEEARKFKGCMHKLNIDFL